jgi:hypothetical protein
MPTGVLHGAPTTCQKKNRRKVDINSERNLDDTGKGATLFNCIGFIFLIFFWVDESNKSFSATQVKRCAYGFHGSGTPIVHSIACQEKEKYHPLTAYQVEWKEKNSKISSPIPAYPVQERLMS